MGSKVGKQISVSSHIFYVLKVFQIKQMHFNKLLLCFVLGFHELFYQLLKHYCTSKRVTCNQITVALIFRTAPLLGV